MGAFKKGILLTYYGPMVKKLKENALEFWPMRLKFEGLFKYED
jgi:hypothetical protein